MSRHNRFAKAWTRTPADEWLRHIDGKMLVVYHAGGRWVWRVVPMQGTPVSDVADTVEEAKRAAEIEAQKCPAQT